MSETVVLVRKFEIGNLRNHGVSSSYDLSFHKLKSVLWTFSVQTIDWPVFVVSELVVGSGEQDTFGEWQIQPILSFIKKSMQRKN